MKRVFLEIVGGLFVIWNFGGFGYIFILGYFLFRLFFIKSKQADDLFGEFTIFGILLFLFGFESFLIYEDGYGLFILFIFLIIYLHITLFLGKG